MDRRARRRRAQAGTTLIEMIVCTAIIGFALLLLVGAFSTGLLDATLEKRNTASDAAVEFELERVQAAAYRAAPQPFSECFAVDSADAPALVGYKAACPAGTNLEVDVIEADVQPGVQQWTVRVATYPGRGAIGSPISIYKINR